MTYYEFIDLLAKTINIEGKQVIWAVPIGGIDTNRPTAFELFYDGIHDGRFIKISKIVTEIDAPELFSKFFAQLNDIMVTTVS